MEVTYKRGVENANEKLDLKGVNLSGLDLSSVDFKIANLEAAKFQGTNYKEAIGLPF